MQYVIQTGDTLLAIASRFGTTVQAILDANPQITNPNLIIVGQVIIIPGGTTPSPPPPPPPPTPSAGTYVVQRGDTLSSIARRFGTTVNALLAANPQITNPNLIFPGQVITIPGGTAPGPEPPPPPPPPANTYVVQRGDTIFSIARRFGTTVPSLLALNPQITNPNSIFPGQVIRLR